jgi:hypothetical protein
VLPQAAQGPLAEVAGLTRSRVNAGMSIRRLSFITCSILSRLRTPSLPL